MVQIPVKDELRHALEHPQFEELPREYLGFSMIGAPCDRSLQFYFRWVDTIILERRIRRLFDFGHLCEEQIRTELRRIGCVFSHDQLELIGFAGHWKGHIDGTVDEVPAHPGYWLVEFKTHKLKFFKQLKKEGVQKGFPAHYDQAQRYMSELSVIGCMYIGYCKDDSEFHIEFIEQDASRQKDLRLKEQHVMFADKLLPRIGTGQITWHECTFCNFKNVCFGRKEIKKTCRSCVHVSVEEGGLWRCEKHSMGLGVEKQKKGCEDYHLDEVFFSD